MSNGTIVVRVILGALLVTLTACDKPDLKSAKGQYSYAIGTQIAKNLKDQKIDLDVKAFNAAIQDISSGKEPRLSEEDRMAALRKMSEGLREKDSAVANDNLKVGQAYLDANKAKEGVKVTGTGLQYEVLTEGKGAKPKESDTVEVHYKGTLIDGKEFDSSYARNQPAQFPVKGVIPGWTEALQLMKTGSKYKLTIPANLAYGAQGNPSIPGNSVLVFEVELLKIVK